MPVDDFVAVCAQKPAIHRFPAAMGKRIHELCVVVTDKYGGRGENVWNEVASGAELADRLRALPGYGDEKTRIFVAILAKRFGVRPEGWEEQAGPFADPHPRSVADVDGPETLERVREWKKAQKAAKKDKQGRPL
jgi:uncharacterized HhH-GPD family protein